MNRHTWRRYLLPIVLGLLGLLLLARVVVANTFFLVPEDIDVIVLVVLLGATMVVAIHTLVDISMSRLRLHSVRQIRRETLAEHRRFLSRLDHELKNPLTALRAGLQTLVLTPLDEQQRKIVDVMETEALRLSGLVTELRKLADLETQPLNLQLVELRAFVGGVVQLEQERFESGERLLTSQMTGSHEVWMVDEDLLALALHNLFDNAFKYTRLGDKCHIEVIAHQELTIRITDTGIGIPQRALPHIWEELYQAHPTDRIPGSGTGLALVKAIVERHGGEVEIESELGQGTTVTLHLPALPV